MASIVVCGGSIIGLTAAMLLAHDGHEVAVFERDPALPPAAAPAAWDAWDRPGVAQFHQPHNLFPRVRRVLESDLPGVYDELAAAGCTWWRPLDVLPPGITDREPRPGDEQFAFVTGRRPTAEAAIANAAQSAAGVRVRRGIAVAGLLDGRGTAGSAPRVTGVRTTARRRARRRSRGRRHGAAQPVLRLDQRARGAGARGRGRGPRVRVLHRATSAVRISRR